MREALDAWFHVNQDYQGQDPHEYLPPIDLKDLNSHNCVVGHFGHEGQYLDQRYPQVFSGYRAAQRYRVFTFMRDPLKMRCSLYRHDLKLGVNRHPDMVSSIMSYNNYFARILHLDQGNWRATLERYFFIGNADDLQVSFDHLAELVNRPKVVLPKTNTTKRDASNTVAALSAAEIAAFKASNQLDYEIFDWVKKRLELM